MEHLPKLNLALAAATALVPLVLGFIWYHPKVFGNAWMKATGITPEDGKKMNMPLVFGLTYVFSFFIAVSLHFMTIHQFAFTSLLEPARGFVDPPNFKETILAAAAISETKFRTWSHGLAHGIITGVTLFLPMVAINAMFERKGWKYILINWGFYTVSFTIMMMIIDQFA
jgi:hypothetical protein